MLADMMLAARRPDRALSEYELDLKFNPNRFNGLYGAGLAAERAGHLEQSREFYGKLVKMCDHSKSQRPELAHAAEVLNRAAIR